MPVTDPRFAELETPCLILDEARFQQNVARLRERAMGLGVALRPHLKTGKSVDVARQVLEGGTGPATVSTLREAEVFAGAGVGDILYAVGISPQKLPRVAALRAGGCDLTVILDSAEQARAIAEFTKKTGQVIPALIEIDSDGHRGGVSPDDPELIEIARILDGAGSAFGGVLTHAGESYGAQGKDAQANFAERERAAVVQAASALAAAGLPCRTVSVGSTPTAHAARSLEGVTELRAGVYTFFDLVMAGIGVCRVEDIALSVLTTVVGHQREKGWVLVDAGWMAMSRDRGTANQPVDQGYGLVCGENGEVIADLILSAANQEHGTITVRPGAARDLPDFPVGTRLRILPNHACATGAQHTRYHVVPAKAGQPLMEWPRFSGW